jgi:filamentous hemagglutinin family protein
MGVLTMNKIYRLIWNHRINNWVVVSELTRARGKKSSSRIRAGLASALLSIAGASAGAGDLASGALPTGGTVTAGQAEIASAGTRMDITQDTQRAIINWQGFDIGSDAQVNFAQPNSTSVTLNRVSGANISRIEGQLTANGQVFLVNPNGVLFSSGARVNASALVASTLDIHDDDFLTGHYMFSGTGGAIENSGSITAAPGGYLAFIAPTITNSGTLSAPQGTVALGAGERVTLNFAGNRLVGLSVGADTLDTLIENRQAIRAEGGAILLSAAGAETVTRSVINQSGVLEASSLTDNGGRIALNADDINVSSTSTISADALNDGDGGTVTILANDAASMHGAISARGGANSGNGGFAEVSGKQWLDFQGQADLRAPNGSVGTLLLDPTDITISGATSTPTSTFGGGAFTNPTTTPSNLNVTTLTNQLALSNVTVSTASALAGNGDITVNNAINYASANSLTLSATRNIAIVAGSGGINNSGTGAVTLTGAAAGSIAVNESITTGGGAIALTSGTGGVNLAASKSIDAGSGTIAVNAGGGTANFTTGTLRTSNATASAVSVTNATTLALGNVALNGGGTLAVSHSGAGSQAGGTAISGTGALAKSGAGTLTLSGTNAYTGTTTVNAGSLALSGGNAIIDTGAVVLANAAGVSLDVATSETIGSLSGGGATGGNVTRSAAGAVTLTTGRNGASTSFDGVIQNGAGTVSLVKEGTGTFTLTNANTYTGTTSVNGGTLSFAGAAGSATGSNLTVNDGSRLLLDNSVTNNNDRVSGTLALNGGEFAVNGNAAANTTETLGALTLNSGYSTVTLTPNAARNTQVTFASLARTAGASGLFRGNNLGANTVASQTAGASNIVFTAAPALTGGGGNSGTATVSIVAGAIGAAGATGSTSTGTDFVTYNPPTGAVNGLRPLLASEYAAAPAANVNLKLTAGRTADDTFSINSLLLSGGVTYNHDSTGGANTLTIASGNVLSVGGTNTIQPTLSAGAIAFGATDAKLFTVSDLVLGSNAPITGTGILGKSGPGLLLENRAVARTGGIIVNSGTLRSGIANSFVSQAVTVRPSGALDLNGFAHTVTSLTLESGATSGATVTTGAGVLTLGGNVALNVNGSGFTGASISGNLTSAATRTFTVANGVAVDDLTIAALISGAGGLTKAGAGTLTLTGANSYSGVTSIGAGTLSASALGNGGIASSIGASTNVAANLVLGGGTLQYTGASVTTDRSYTLTAATTSSINVTSAATNLTMSGASTATTGALTKAGAGTLTLAGTNLHTGLNTVAGGALALGANNALATGGVTVNGGTLDIGAFSDAVGAVTLTNGTITGTSGVLSGTSTAVSNGVVSAILGGAGGLTKATAGTVTLTRANTYTGVTTVNAGVLSVASLANGGTASSIGASTNAAANLLLGGGTLQYTGANVATDRNFTLTAGTTSSIDVSSAAANLTVSGASAATTGALTKLGDGTLTLTGANANTGATTIRTGTLQVGNGGAAGALGTGAVTDLGRLVLNRSDAVSFANVVSGFGDLVLQGTGTTTLTGANTYTGATTINAGTLQLGAANRISDLSAVTIASGATFNLATFSETVGSIAGAGNLALGTGTLTSGGDNSSTTLSGIVSGTGGLIKSGTGSLTLSGNNTYSGATSVAAGTLVAANANALGATTTGTTVTAGATLNINNVALAAEPITLNGAGVGAAGALTGTGTASVAGTVTQASASTIGTTSAATTLTLGGIVTAPTLLTIAGPGALAASNAANNFSTVAASSSGSVTLRDTNDIILNASTLGGALNVRAAGIVTVAGAVSSTAAGDAIVLSGARFVNSVGASALSATSGRWLVWSSNANPFGGATPDSRNGLVYAFKQYGATFGVTPVAQPTGNGFLYSLAPTITPSLTGTTSKVYDGTTAATLLASNFSAAGAVDGDTVALSSTGATYNNRNVGAAKPVTATGIAATATNGAATVYGYALSSTSAAGNIGTITAATLTVTAQADSRVYNGTTTSSAAPVVSGTTYDAVGTAATQAFNNRNAGAGKTLTASGLVMNDGNAGANYAISYVNNTTGVITPAALTVTAQTDSRGYNGTTTSSGAPVLSGATYDAVGTAATQAFSNKNAGVGKTLVASGLVMNDGNGGANYTVSYINNITGVITPAALTVTAQSDNRVYNGTTSSGVSPLLTGTTFDAVGTAATQAYDNRNAGIGKTLTASGLVMNDGNAGANYAVSYVSNNTGVITPAALTVTAQADTRGYNGTTSSSAAPVVTGTAYDAIGTAATQAFDNRNAGVGKTLTAGGLVLSDGNGGANYAVTYVNNTAGVITPAALTVTAQADNRVYNGTTSSSAAPVVTGTTYDAIGTAATQAFDNRNAGLGKTLTASGLVLADGNGGANYAISYVDNTAGVITPAALTVTAQTDSRAYDGTTSSSAAPVVTGATYDVVGTAATQTFDNRNAGVGKTLTASGLLMADGNAGANYAISYVNNTTGVITAAALTVTAQADTRGYNGTTSSSVAPVVIGTTYDVIGTAATQTFDNRNAGAGKTLTASGLVLSDGNGGANYAVTYVNNTAGVITPAALTVTAQADTRGYNGTTSSSVAPVVTGTTYDVIGTAATQTFDNRNAGVGKTLTAGGLLMNDGNGGGNYAVNYVNDTTGVITPAALTVTSQTDTRGYNGTTSSSVAPVVSGTTYDAIGTAATQTFDNRNAGVGKTLTAGGLLMNDGNGGGNYAVNYVNDTTGVIAPAALTVTAQTDTRGYDGTTASSAAPVVSGTTYDAIGTAATQTFDNRNVGIGKTLTAGGLVMVDGNAGANYVISYVNNTTGVITPAALTVTAQADTRVYNGTTTSSAAPVVTGTTYDAVGIAATQTFDNRNAGVGKTLAAAGLLMSDGNGGGNYAVSYVSNTTGVITPAALTVTAQADTRGYNGTNSSSVAPVTSGTTYDAIGTAATQTFDNRNVGNGKTLTANGLVLSDGNGGANYTISYANNTAGVITPAAVTVTAQADTRVYNGTTSSSVAPVVSGTTYDAIGTAATQTFDNRNAGNSKTLTAGGLVLADGNAGANYTINYVTSTAGVITPAPLTVTAQADTRVYNGTTTSSGTPVLTGTTYDAVGTAATQAFANRNAGIGKTLTASGLLMNDGNGGANYAVSYVNSTAGVITPAPLTVTAQPDTRVYNGTTASSAAPVVTGTTYDPMGTAATQAFDNRNAGSGKTLTASGLLMNDGNSGANYAVGYVNNTAGVITPAPLAITADDTQRPARTPNPPFTATYTGLVGGDTSASLNGTLGFATSATFESPKGDYPITPSGQSSSNYTIAYVDGVLKVTAQLRPPVYAAWGRFDPQAVASSYTNPALPDLRAPKPAISILSGGLNVRR